MAYSMRTKNDWLLYHGITEGGLILSIHEDYFLLTGGVERWLYRVARKHAGSQETGWQFTMRQLYEKSASAARFPDFHSQRLTTRLIRRTHPPRHPKNTRCARLSVLSFQPKRLFLVFPGVLACGKTRFIRRTGLGLSGANRLGLLGLNNRLIRRTNAPNLLPRNGFPRL